MIKMKDIKRVYVAGKISDEAIHYIKNIHRICQNAEDIRKMGYAVYVPGTDFLMGFLFGYWDYNDYFNNSVGWLKVSDLMYVSPGWETSSGVKKEIEIAKQLGIPIVYGVVGELPSITIRRQISFD